MNTATRHFYTFVKDGQTRKISYLQTGNDHPLDVFFCLPGLLETSQSFDSLITHVNDLDTCAWVCIEYSGRGHSDPLPSTESYAMTVYLQETKVLIEHWMKDKTHLNINIHLIGTSMGGLLAMQLVSQNQIKFKSVILNDIGLVLYWPALANLYLKIKQHPDILKKLSADPRAVRAVQQPQHFDLGCKVNFEGMRFHEWLAHTKSRLYLIHSVFSPICPIEVARESVWRCPGLTLWSQPGNAHPVHWTPEIVKSMKTALNLVKQPATCSTMQSIKADGFLEISQKHFSEKTQRTFFKRFLDWLKNQLIDIQKTVKKRHW